jgi:hypothetical protein
MVYSNRDIGGGMAITVNGNRLDADWVCSDGLIRDHFTMMKDVNKKVTISINQSDSVLLKSSWFGTYNWTDGSVADQIYFSSNTPKTDTLVVRDNYFCLKDTFIIKKNTISGINTKNNKEDLIKVYPNPSTTGDFMIEFNSIESKNSSIKVFDLEGKIILEDSISIQNGITFYNLKLNAFPSTVYFINIEGHTIEIKK